MSGLTQPVTQWVAGVDAVTLVGSERDFNGFGEWEYWSFAMQLQEGGTKWKKQMWSAFGYDGWRVGSCSFGSRVDGKLRLQATGPTAQVLLQRVGGIDVRCARIDLQVTAWHEDTAEKMIERSFVESSLQHRAAPRLKPRALYIDAAGYGNTCYIGSRTQEKFVRVYDKGAQTGHEAYQGSVRYEVELKDGAAQKAYDEGKDVEFARTWVAAQVAEYLRWAGVWALNSLRGLGTTTHKLPAGTDDADRKLSWIRRNVRPSVAWLLTQVPRDDILAALGLLEGAGVAQNFVEELEDGS